MGNNCIYLILILVALAVLQLLILGLISIIQYKMKKIDIKHYESSIDYIFLNLINMKYTDSSTTDIDIDFVIDDILDVTQLRDRYEEIETEYLNKVKSIEERDDKNEENY